MLPQCLLSSPLLLYFFKGMGNSAPTPHHGAGARSRAARIEEFKQSNEWQYIQNHLVRPLKDTVSTPDSQLATLVMLSAGRRGLRDYAQLYGDLPSDSQIKALFEGHETLIQSTEAAYDLFGSCVASMADFMSVALDPSLMDGAVEAKLNHVFADGAVGSAPDTTSASLREPYASKLLKYPSVVQGLQELTAFHQRHLSGRVLDKDWTWADSARVALIVMTSLQWEIRLHKEFGTVITQSVVTSIAQEQVQILAKENNGMLRNNMTMRVAILRALDVSLVAA